MIGYNCDLETQKQILHSILQKNSILYEVIKGVQDVGLDKYYIGAGCISQTVWNYQNGFDLMYGISDVDFVYFDENTSYEKEDAVIKQIEHKFSHLPIKIDVKNQSRVHLWFQERFGYEIQPYQSLEQAINTWPTTSNSIGVKLVDDRLVVYAPFGLNDMFGQIVRANKTQITEETFLQKSGKWREKWHTLKIISW